MSNIYWKGGWVGQKPIWTQRRQIENYLNPHRDYNPVTESLDAPGTT